jgi:hypothetical protein
MAGEAGVAGTLSCARDAPWRLSRKTPTLAKVMSFFMLPHLLKKGLRIISGGGAGSRTPDTADMSRML